MNVLIIHFILLKVWRQDATLFVYLYFFSTAFIQSQPYNTIIRRQSLRFLYISSSPVSSVELGPALQKSDALSTDLRLTSLRPRRTGVLRSLFGYGIAQKVRRSSECAAWLIRVRSSSEGAA
jgi:hypothetical protein